MAALCSRLGKCEVCACKDAKYTCPKCEVKTCCIACANIHKKELSCSGVRDKVDFKQLSKFTNMDLQSAFVQTEGAASSRNIRWHFLPRNFSRHKDNTTYLDWKTNIIWWRVEWIFPQGNNIKCVDERLGENVRDSSHINKYLDPAVCDLSLREHLQFYQSAGLSGVHLMLKAEKVPKAGVWYYEMDPALSLKENLAGKCVIEFPTVYVVLKHHKHLFETLDSDEEFEEYDETSRNFPNKFNRTGHSGFTRTNMNGVANRGMNKTNNFLFNHPDNSDSSDAEQNVKTPKLDIPPYHVLIKQHQK